MIIGIDPGKKGALAALHPSGSLQVHDLHAKPERSGKAQREFLSAMLFRGVGVRLAVLEDPHNMPGEGGSSSFKFGRECGRIEGLLWGMRIRHQLVKPEVWKSLLNLGHDKDTAVEKAIKLFPESAHLFRGPRGGGLDGRAEAALLAYYGKRFLSGVGGGQ